MDIIHTRLIIPSIFSIIKLRKKGDTKKYGKRLASLFFHKHIFPWAILLFFNPSIHSFILRDQFYSFPPFN